MPTGRTLTTHSIINALYDKSFYSDKLKCVSARLYSEISD